MIYQTDPRLGRYYNKYGCLFTSIAYAREYLGGPDWTPNELRAKWEYCIARGFISGDMNKDGDMDDDDELVIQDHNNVCSILGVPLSYIPGHHNPNVVIEKDMYAIGAFRNPRTNFVHFAVIDRNKKVIFDPIEGGSRTVREGYLKSMRLYSVMEGVING